MKYSITMAALLVAASGIAVQADELGWSSSAELGAITTTGNTEGTSVTGRINSMQRLERFNNEYYFSAFFKEDKKRLEDGSSERERTAERFKASVKSAFKLEKEYDNLFVLGSHTDDKFGAYRKYSTLAVGYGTRLLDRANQSLNVEVGPGYSYGKTATGDTESGLLARAGAFYKWAISEHASFGQDLVVEYGEDNTRTSAETSVTARINGRMQMKAAFIVQNDSDVPVDKKRTDTQTSLTLVYSF
jgi:putative salt-induced outer membrane protein